MHFREIFRKSSHHVNTNKGSIVKQSGNAIQCKGQSSRPNFVMPRPELKIPTLAEWLISPLCLSQFQLGTPPRATPGKIFLSERRIPATRAIFFVQFPAPGAKNDGRIPGGGAKFSQTRRNCSLSLQEILKKLRKLRDSTIFLFGELNKTFLF